MKCLWCEDPIEQLLRVGTKELQFCDNECRECYEIVVEGKGTEINYVSPIEEEQCNDCGALIIGYHACQGIPGEEEKGGEG